MFVSFQHSRLPYTDVRQCCTLWIILKKCLFCFILIFFVKWALYIDRRIRSYVYKFVLLSTFASITAYEPLDKILWRFCTSVCVFSLFYSWCSLYQKHGVCRCFLFSVIPMLNATHLNFLITIKFYNHKVMKIFRRKCCYELVILIFRSELFVVLPLLIPSRCQLLIWGYSFCDSMSSCSLNDKLINMPSH